MSATVEVILFSAVALILCVFSCGIDWLVESRLVSLSNYDLLAEMGAQLRTATAPKETSRDTSRPDENDGDGSFQVAVSAYSPGARDCNGIL